MQKTFFIIEKIKKYRSDFLPHFLPPPRPPWEGMSGPVSEREPARVVKIVWGNNLSNWLHFIRRRLHFFGMKTNQKHQILTEKDQIKLNLLKRVTKKQKPKTKPKQSGL